MLESIITTTQTGEISLISFLLCTLASLLIGIAAAFIYMYRNNCSGGFAVTLALLPAMVQVVIMLVNGNIGAGVAVMGAFSLIRFRSAPGSARDIGTIFFAMAIGLATGMGYVWVALIFLAAVGGMNILLTTIRFGEQKKFRQELRITIPESLDYTDVFKDVFEKYTRKAELVKVKTTNMGSMFQLQYNIELKSESDEKKFIDELRCRNGNLTIVCSVASSVSEEL